MCVKLQYMCVLCTLCVCVCVCMDLATKLCCTKQYVHVCTCTQYVHVCTCTQYVHVCTCTCKITTVYSNFDHTHTYVILYIHAYMYVRIVQYMHLLDTFVPIHSFSPRQFLYHFKKKTKTKQNHLSIN